MSIFRYTAPAYATRLLILLFDIFLAFVSIHVAAILRHNLDMSRAFDLVGWSVISVVAVRIISFRWFRTYAVIVRFVGAADIVQVFLAVSGGSILLMGMSILLRPYGYYLPLSILLIDFFLLIFMMSGVRLLMPSLYYILFSNRKEQTNIAIIGAGQLGAITRNVIRQDAKSNYNISAIFDDNPHVHQKVLDGIPVYNPARMPDIVKEEGVEKVIFAIKNIDTKRKNELVDILLEENVKVLQVPFQSDWFDEDFKIGQLKEIEIDDLLNRSAIVLDQQSLTRQFTGKRILVTGGAGSIGSELVRQLIKYSPGQLLVIDQAETPLVNLGLECREEYQFENLTPIIADVTEEGRLEGIFEKHKPQIVFHAAAYKHVPIMEAFPREAIHVNIAGSKLVADMSHKYKVEKFVMVSTDKAVNPTNVMGASKRIAEIYIQSLNEFSETGFITTRFGNVLGSNGSVVPRFKKQIAQGGPITVTHPDITRYFMTIPEASQLVLEAGAMGDGGEIFLFDMGEPVKIVDLASKMIQLSGFKPNVDVDIIFSGLRPGEKLTEELLSSAENSLETHHPKITKALVRKYKIEEVRSAIGHLIASLDTEGDMYLVEKMKGIVPEFISNNSVFDVIDKKDKGV